MIVGISSEAAGAHLSKNTALLWWGTYQLNTHVTPSMSAKEMRFRKPISHDQQPDKWLASSMKEGKSHSWKMRGVAGGGGSEALVGTQLGLHRAEVNRLGDGRKWGRAETGWLTWAFVGRWWEAPPWPPSQNAKQHCYCVMSAARFSGNQKKTTKKKKNNSVEFTVQYQIFIWCGNEEISRLSSGVISVSRVSGPHQHYYYNLEQRRTFQPGKWQRSPCQNEVSLKNRIQTNNCCGTKHQQFLLTSCQKRCETAEVKACRCHS